MPASLPDTPIKIYANDWVATIFTGPANPDGFFHVYATTVGSTEIHAFVAAEHVLNAFAWGRLAFIRSSPEAWTETDFDTKITHHKGFVRFSYKLEVGAWQYPDQSQFVSLSGF
jgi:hypothetical protein